MKIRVLVVGEVLLKGRPVKLTELGEALKQGAAARTAVSYYRELASGEPPALAIQVLKLITELRLPIRLSSQPDFSDTITTSERRLEDIFAEIRESAAQGQVVILRPGGRQNSGVKRNVAVLGETAWTITEKPSLQAANRERTLFHGRRIPFVFHFLPIYSPIFRPMWGGQPSIAGRAVNSDAGRASDIPPGARQAQAYRIDR